MSFSTSVFAGLDTTLPQAIINRQSDANLRQVALSAFVLLAPGMDTAEGSFAYDLIEPFCLVLAQAYIDLIDVERRTSLATATGLDLDRLGELYAVSRGPSSWAVGFVTFTGATGSVIPAGTVVNTLGANAQLFQTDVAATIPGPGPTNSIDVPATAQDVGAAGNVPAQSIVGFGSTVPAGVSTVINAAAFTNGADVQQDGQQNQYFVGYRADIYNLANTRGEGGAAKHLRKWARSVPGVGGVRVLEITPTSGWATVVLLGTNGLPATADVVHAVEATILDPWYIYQEAESAPIVRTGAGATLQTQSDGTPLGGTNNVVRLLGAAGSFLRQLNVGPILGAHGQPGVWRIKPRIKVSSAAASTNLLNIGMWNINTGTWCVTRPNGSISCLQTFAANRFTTAFVQPDIDPTSIDFAWNGYDTIELHIDLAGADTTTSAYIDQISYFAVMSRDDRDVGLSPAGMRVNVVPAGAVTINVSATINYSLTVGQTIATVSAAITQAVSDYFVGVAFSTDQMIRVAAVENAIYDTPGVGDVSLVRLNGGTANISLMYTQVGVLGTTTWTAA